MDEIVNW